MTEFLKLQPRDPIIARDGRPFSAGSRMKSLDWPYSSVTAGSLRTLLGKRNSDSFDTPTQDALKAIAVCGPFPVALDELCLPAPADISIREDDGRIFCARPETPRPGEGTDLRSGLEPVLLNLAADDDDFKPGDVPAFWSVSRLAEWLCDPCGNTFDPAGRPGFYSSAVTDERFHVRMGDSGVAKEGMLFSTSARDLGSLPLPERGPFQPRRETINKEDDESMDDRRRKVADEITLAVRVAADTDNAQTSGLDQLQAWHPMGGERRLVHWQAESQSAELWNCPASVRDALKGATHVRMVLASPAIFDVPVDHPGHRRVGGWCPEWIDSTGDSPTWTGSVPGTTAGGNDGVRVKLVGACVDRWRPVSGWSYELGGPKAVRRLVPAGSVFFFEVLKDSIDPGKLADCWLQSVSDQAEGGQSARDGFGLAVWGVWSRHPAG